MIRYLSLEFYKIRRRGVFLTALLLCGVEGAWTAYSVQSYFEENGANLIWNNLFTNLAMLHGLFLPLAIAVLSSRICDMEHKGDTWKLLGAAAEPMGKLYFAKFLCTFLLLTVTLVLELAALLTFAAWRGFPGPIPVGLVGKVFLGTMLVSVFVLALQQWIAMAVPNQLVALIVGMAGSFLGLVGALFPAQVRAFLPWCGYAELSSVQAVPLGDHEWQYLAMDPNIVPALLVFVLGIVVYFLGKRRLCRKEF